MNFNTTVKLWRNLYLSLREPLVITDGHIIEHRNVIGRFDSSTAAEACLIEAGYVKGIHFIVKETSHG